MPGELYQIYTTLLANKSLQAQIWTMKATASFLIFKNSRNI